MLQDAKRRDVLLGLSALVGASVLSSAAFAAGKGYLVRGPKGEYYFFSDSELNAIAHKGQCKATECKLVSPPSVYVRNGDVGKFELSDAQRIAPQITDKTLLPGLNDIIKRRQALGSQMSEKLISQGFTLGTMNPTKAG
jgi:hypothetical protein